MVRDTGGERRRGSAAPRVALGLAAVGLVVAVLAVGGAGASRAELAAAARPSAGDVPSGAGGDALAGAASGAQGGEAPSRAVLPSNEPVALAPPPVGAVEPAASSVVAAASADAAGHESDSAEVAEGQEPSPAARAPIESMMLRLRLELAEQPLYLTGSFDGSQRFGMWSATMRFARELGAEIGRPVHFTYFVNSCYYDPTVRGSQIGRAASAEEVLVRRALTQQAINEGHEIGDHTVRHRDGGAFTRAEWDAEIGEFDRLMEGMLFEPVLGDVGRPVFPRFAALDGVAAGATGAVCRDDAECEGGSCLSLGPDTSLCTQPCNRKLPCPEATACGTPRFSKDTDVCVPLPRYPIVHHGVELFDAAGAPNRAHPELHPYDIVGFRAPNLSFDDALFQSLLAHGYRYDASQVFMPGLPLLIFPPGVEEGRKLVGFGLSAHPGTAIIPMDYNYLTAGRGGAQMLNDYRANILAAYATRTPWAIGHHFAPFRGGEYVRAMQEALRFAARGCPDEAGARRCTEVEIVNYRELYERLRALVRATRARRAAAAADGGAAP